MSRATLNASFFDQLWPLILEENICDIRSKNTSKFFDPEEHFDYMWAHELLAAKGYKNYQKPKELKLPLLPDETTQTVVGPVSAESAKLSEEDCIGQRKPEIETLAEQNCRLRLQRERCQRLAYEYVNRKFPWYMNRSSYQDDFEITDEIRAEFRNAFEMNILENIHRFHCKLIIIDVAPEITMNAMERWMKFCKYALLVAVSRCETMAHRLALLKGTFHSILMEENLENSWQEELAHSLNLAKSYSKQKNFELDCGHPFIFVFSKKQSSKTWDMFKILKKL